MKGFFIKLFFLYKFGYIGLMLLIYILYIVSHNYSKSL